MRKAYIIVRDATGQILQCLKPGFVCSPMIRVGLITPAHSRSPSSDTRRTAHCLIVLPYSLCSSPSSKPIFTSQKVPDTPGVPLRLFSPAHLDIGPSGLDSSTNESDLFIRVDLPDLPGHKHSSLVLEVPGGCQDN